MAKKQISERQVEILIEQLVDKMQKANELFLSNIGEKIKKIKSLKPSEAHQLIQILKYGGNYEEIVKKISKVSELNVKQLDKIFKAYSINDSRFAEDFYKYRNIPFVEYNQHTELKRQTEALANIAKQQMYDFTRNNVLGYTIKDKNGKEIFQGLRQVYNSVLDEAFINVGQGKDTFDNAMRKILRDIGDSGLKTINYESGRSVRLDSTIRMHLHNRLNELHNENQKLFGEEYGADGVEISVHENPAPDHTEVQGRQFSNEEYEKLQNGEEAKGYNGKTYSLDHDGKNGYRPISEMNCYHTIFSIILGVSEPEYTDQELRQIIRDNNKKFKYEGKKYTRYEGTQLQRQLERRIREEKDKQILARTSGDEAFAGLCQRRIDMLTHKYSELSQISGLKTKANRMRVSEYKRSAVSTKAYKKNIEDMKVGEFNVNDYTDTIKSTTSIVVFTPERKQHVISHHPEVEDLFNEVSNIIENPDRVFLQSKKYNTLWLTKNLNGSNVKLTLKINTEKAVKDLGFSNSIINMQYMREKEILRNIRKKKIKRIYKKRK